jgi:Zn-dependent protease with chaperone function
MKDSKAASFDESQLRHPLEHPYFLGSVTLSLIVVAAAIVVIVFAPDWVTSHALLSKQATFVRAALVAALAGMPLLVLLRHRRDAYVHGQSIRLSRNQFAPIYEILERQCQRLGVTEVPGLYITDKGIPPYSKAFSTRSDHSIVLHQNLFEVDLQKTLDVAAFTIGHELGRIRLGHTDWLDELLLTYVFIVPFVANPLRQLRTFSRDRYGAYLAPDGFRGLLFAASARRLLNDVNVDDYLKQADGYGGAWVKSALYFYDVPSVLRRVQELKSAGFDVFLKSKGDPSPAPGG